MSKATWLSSRQKRRRFAYFDVRISGKKTYTHPYESNWLWFQRRDSSDSLWSFSHWIDIAGSTADRAEWRARPWQLLTGSCQTELPGSKRCSIVRRWFSVESPEMDQSIATRCWLATGLWTRADLEPAGCHQLTIDSLQRYEKQVTMK